MKITERENYFIFDIHNKGYLNELGQDTNEKNCLDRLVIADFFLD